jgi:hypothetical protein
MACFTLLGEKKRSSFPPKILTGILQVIYFQPFSLKTGTSRTVGQLANCSGAVIAVKEKKLNINER